MKKRFKRRSSLSLFASKAKRRTQVQNNESVSPNSTEAHPLWTHQACIQELTSQEHSVQLTSIIQTPSLPCCVPDPLSPQSFQHHDKVLDTPADQCMQALTSPKHSLQPTSTMQTPPLPRYVPVPWSSASHSGKILNTPADQSIPNKVMTNAPQKTARIKKIGMKQLFGHSPDSKETCLQEIEGLLPAMEGGFMHDFVILCRMIALGKLPTDNISLLLCLERAKYQSCSSTTTMKYDKRTLRFWKVFYRICHGKALRLMSGPEKYGNHSWTKWGKGLSQSRSWHC